MRKIDGLKFELADFSKSATVKNKAIDKKVNVQNK